MMSKSRIEEENVGIRVSTDLVKQVIRLNNWSPDMPANYAVDSALRDYIELRKLEAKKQ